MRLPAVHRARSGAVASVVTLALLAPAAAGAVPEDLRNELTQAQQRLDDLDTTASTAVEAYNEAAAALAAAQGELASATGAIETLADDVAIHQHEADGLIREMAKLGPGLQLQALLAAENPGQVAARTAMVRRLYRQQTVTLEAFIEQRDELDAMRQRLAADRTDAAMREQATAERRAELEQTLAQQKDEVGDLTARIAEIERQEAAEAARVEAARVAAARAEAARVEATRAEAARAARDAAARAEAARTVATEDRTTARPSPPATTPPQTPAPRVTTPPPPQPAATTPFEPTPPPAAEPPPPPAAGVRTSGQAAVDAALTQVGKPYRWGGSGPDSYDCSGLTSWAWAHSGVSLPHSSRMQFASTTPITRGELSPGDMIFFGSPIHHVAIYIGDGRVVEAPYSGTTVRVSSRALGRSDIAGYRRP